MKPVEPEFTIGVEEEYLLVDCQSGALAVDPPSSLIDECEKHVGKHVTSELQRSQIEIGTAVCHNLEELRAELVRLRSGVVEVAGRHGLAPIAASTHPFSPWSEQKQTQKQRYEDLLEEMKTAAKRMVICGMHAHIGIADEELRIDLMNQVAYFLPHLLALSCSSPFWGGHDTGFKSYRLTIFDTLPRTGIPERFRSYAEYQRHVKLLVDCGIIEDASTIWWDLRPHSRFPTLEVRIMDVCTRVDDAISLVAVLACLLRMLYRLRVGNLRWRNYSAMLLRENRWRAMRYSFDEGMLDLGRGGVVPFDQLIEELLDLIDEDAQALGCKPEVTRIREIRQHGTSAHQQLRVYKKAQEEGASDDECLKAVVDYLRVATAETS